MVEGAPASGAKANTFTTYSVPSFTIASKELPSAAIA